MKQLPFFVYGTLRKMFHNHGFIANAFKDVEEAKINGVLTYENGLPWAYKTEHIEDIIKGELYTMSDHVYPDVLRVLDNLEGHPTMYERTQIKTLDGIDCWVYFSHGNPPREDVIKSGDFAEYMS